mmetsp:Transcript_34661/g.74828  ORF Transcript_34661/g.74828 Transcript_34661/m.74828 type:complete len:118 (-) Transcript_34661:1435-1788(-)
MEIEDPKYPIPNTENEEPIRLIPSNDSEELWRAMFLTDSEEPKWATAMTETFGVKPTGQAVVTETSVAKTLSRIDSELPSRANCLNDIDDPRCTKSKTEMAEPMRAKDRTDIADPNT